MKTKIQHDEITKKILENFTIQDTGYTEFREHIISEDMIPKNFNIGLIVGKSGSGKTTLLKKFGTEKTVQWDDRAIASHFDSYEDAEERLLGAGLASIPSWLKPYKVLSNGERHRADLARAISSDLVIDEFVSYVDDDAALGLANSIQRFIRQKKFKNIVFATLNNSLKEYLKPDWVYCTDDKTLTINSEVYDVEMEGMKINYKKRKHFMEIS